MLKQKSGARERFPIKFAKLMTNALDCFGANPGSTNGGAEIVRSRVGYEAGEERAHKGFLG